MRKIHILPYLLLFSLLFSACNRAELPMEGVYYKVSVGGEEGIAIFHGLQKKSLSGKLYRDQGRLFATPEMITVRSKRDELEMVFPDGSKAPFSCDLYRRPIPPYRELDPVKPYTEPLYGVERVDSVRYATAKGYYSSYPCPHDWSFVDIYGRKISELNYFRRSSPFFDIINRASNDLLFRDKKKDLDLDLDLYVPLRSDGGKRPLIVMIHGGAFFNGDKGQPEYVDWCNHFASLGYVAASINYRLGYGLNPGLVKEAGYMAVQDARAAIRYLLSREDLLIDQERIFVAGTSAGAITALNVAFMENSERPAGMDDLGRLDSVAPEYQKEFTIRGVGSMWGAVTDTTLIDKKEKTDIISFHNVNDDMVPYGKGIPFEVLFLPFSIREKLFGIMYGSKPVTESAQEKGLRAELVSYDIENTPNHLSELHSIHFNTNGERNERFQEIQDKLTAFFSVSMELHPTLLDHQGQLFHLTDKTDILDCYWDVKGGLVLDEDGPFGIRVLLFRDEPAFSVTVDGTYASTGMTFRLTDAPSPY